MSWSIDSYAQQAEGEIWDAIVENDPGSFSPAAALNEARAPEPVAVATSTDDDAVPCHDCGGDGLWKGRGAVVNGVFTGPTGTCFRCGGKGHQTAADVRRNNYYDNRVRRYNA